MSNRKKAVNHSDLAAFSISKGNKETASFKHIIRLQFNTLMMIVIKRTLKHQQKQLLKQSQQMSLFCEISETRKCEHGYVDEYSCDFMAFQVLLFTTRVHDEKIGMALQELSEKQRNVILLYYFLGMIDWEIAELYHVSYSAISFTE